MDLNQNQTLGDQGKPDDKLLHIQVKEEPAYRMDEEVDSGVSPSHYTTSGSSPSSNGSRPPSQATYYNVQVDRPSSGNSSMESGSELYDYANQLPSTSAAGYVGYRYFGHHQPIAPNPNALHCGFGQLYDKAQEQSFLSMYSHLGQQQQQQLQEQQSQEQLLQQLQQPQSPCEQSCVQQQQPGSSQKQRRTEGKSKAKGRNPVNVRRLNGEHLTEVSHPIKCFICPDLPRMTNKKLIVDHLMSHVEIYDPKVQREQVADLLLTQLHDMGKKKPKKQANAGTTGPDGKTDDNDDSKSPIKAFTPKINGKGEIKIEKCKPCNLLFLTKAQYWKHKDTVHINAEKCLRCSQCPFTTKYKHHLDYHENNHINLKPFQCDLCDYTCANKSMLTSHKKSHEDICEYKCKTCSYQVKYFHSFKSHILSRKHEALPIQRKDGSIIHFDFTKNKRLPRLTGNGQRAASKPMPLPLDLTHNPEAAASSALDLTNDKSQPMTQMEIEDHYAKVFPDMDRSHIPTLLRVPYMLTYMLFLNTQYKAVQNQWLILGSNKQKNNNNNNTSMDDGQQYEADKLEGEMSLYERTLVGCSRAIAAASADPQAFNMLLYHSAMNPQYVQAAAAAYAPAEEYSDADDSNAGDEDNNVEDSAVQEDEPSSRVDESIRSEDADVSQQNGQRDGPLNLSMTTLSASTASPPAVASVTAAVSAPAVSTPIKNEAAPDASMQFSCVFCYSTYSSQGMLNLHYTTHSPDNVLKCSKCSMVFMNPAQFADHIALRGVQH